MYGWEMPDMPGDYFALTADHLFGTIWTRPGLSMREKRMMTLTCVTALGISELAEIQANAALANGELTVPVRRAANEAAALAWVTSHPLLLFPALFEEKARITRRQFERQIAVRARSRELLAA